MRALPIAAAALLALAAPSVAYAEDAPPDLSESSLSELSEKLADPRFQDQAATMAEALLGVFLEMPIGPMAEAVGKATGGEVAADIDPDARIVDLAPEAEALPEKLSDRLPQAMTAMSGMAEGMELMLPALREMAERMKGVMDDGRDLR
ncbi:MAG: hypothetical protein AAGL68_01805 [Pseudomonadota bacterium]